MHTNIPVLMYHDVTDKDESAHRYTLNLRALEEQFCYLCKNSYHSLSAQEYLESVKSEHDNLWGKRIVLTFDDGYISYFTDILPLLERYKLKAIFFVTTDNIGKDKSWLDWQHLIEMQARGMSIQGHAHTHRFLNDLNTEELTQELVESKSLLEDKLGSKVDFFSCPGGRFNKRVIAAANKLGYKGMFTSVPGFNNSKNHDFLILNRFLITNNVSFADFVSIINLNEEHMKIIKAKYYLKYLFKGLLGNKMYHYIWKRLIKNEY